MSSGLVSAAFSFTDAIAERDTRPLLNLMKRKLRPSPSQERDPKKTKNPIGNEAKRKANLSKKRKMPARIVGSQDGELEDSVPIIEEEGVGRAASMSPYVPFFAEQDGTALNVSAQDLEV